MAKEWKNTGDAALPDSVTVQLKKNGQNYGAPFQLTAADGWAKTVTVPAGAGTLTWSVVEDAVEGFSTSYSADVAGSGTITVTNTYTGARGSDQSKPETKKDVTKKSGEKSPAKKSGTPKTGDVLLGGGAIAAVAGTGVFGVVASRIRRRK